MTQADLSDASPSDLRIIGRSGALEPGDALLNLSVTRTVDGASTLELSLNDPERKVLNSDVWKGSRPGDVAATCEFGGLKLRLVNLSRPAARRLTVTFEEQAIWKLRQFTNPKHVSRSKFTRAQFVKSLCDEAGVPYVIADLNTKQEIAPVKLTQAQKDAKRHPGLATHAKIQVAGVTANSEQTANMVIALDEAALQAAGPKATLALVEACIVEPGTSVATGFFTNPSKAVDHTSTGILQLLASTAKGLGISPTDVRACCNAFLTKGFFGQGGAIAIAKAHPDWTAGTVAQAVQGSAYPARYDIYHDDAQKIIDAYTGGDSAALTGSASASGSYAKTYYFQRGQDGVREDSWTAIKRLAVEVNWYAFCEDGTIYFLSPEYLRRSRPRMLIEPDAPGIESEPTFDYDTSKKAQNTITLQARVGEWAAPPGSVVEVEGFGPLDGRDWIVGQITRPKFSSNLCQVTVQRIRRHKDEPAHEIVNRTGTTAGDVIGDTVSGDTARIRVVTAAKHAAELSSGDKTYYKYNEDHYTQWKDDLFERDSATDRSDCSSFVIQCYAKGLGGYQHLPRSLQKMGNTGTLAAAGKRTNSPQPGDVCLYGQGPGYHHAELYVGGGKTIGHGSPPVDSDTARNPALGVFAGYWTFTFLEETSKLTGSSTSDLPSFQP